MVTDRGFWLDTARSIWQGCGWRTTDATASGPVADADVFDVDSSAHQTFVTSIDEL
jgi:hypothetical protein